MAAKINFDPIRGYDLLAIWQNDNAIEEKGYFRYTWVQRDTQVAAVDGSGCFYLYEVYYLKAMCDYNPFLEFDSTFINRSDESELEFAVLALVYDKGESSGILLVDGLKYTNF